MSDERSEAVLALILAVETSADSEYEMLGNDGETLWRIIRRGSLKTDGCWELRRQRKVMGRWEKFGTGYPTRAEAIRQALRSEAPAEASS